MVENKVLKSIISLVVMLSIMVSTVGCSFAQETNFNKEVIVNENNSVIVDNVEINDSFVPLEIKGIEIVSLNVEEINIDEILVNCIEVDKIDNIEIEVTSINDEFVYLAYKNFRSFYGDDFDLGDFLTDAGIGGGCILIYVTLSVAGGPVGTFFGGVITSQLTTSAIVIGAAIDAAVSAYQAYQEGGDASYIIGHMLNGVADGFKWTAILAPLTGSVDGIKALKAVDALRKVPGFEEVTDKQAGKIFKEIANILRKSTEIGDDLTDDAIKNLYLSMSKEFTEEVTEDMFRDMFVNRQLLTDIVKKFNPFNTSREVVKAMQDDFIKSSGMADDAIIKAIKQGTIRNIDDITDKSIREYIEKNMYEFASCFGGSLSKDFVDSCMRKNMGDDLFELIKKSITSNDLYVDLVDKLGRDAAEKMLKDSNTIALLQLRYGANNVNKLLSASILYRLMQRSGNNINDVELRQVMNGLMNGSLKSLDDVKRISATVANNLSGSREAVSAAVKNLGNEKALSGLLNDIAKSGFESLEFAKELNQVADLSTDIFINSISKTEIVSKYGDDVYRTLLENYNLTINCLNVQATVNKSLIEDLTIDALTNNDITDEVIKNILAGKRVSEWGLVSNNDIMKIYNIVADYYKVNNTVTYRNYVKEIAERRGEVISDFLEVFKQEGNTLTNVKYAGYVMNPPDTYTVSQVAYVKAQYGDIYMSKSGFPIFDDYAIARVEISDLTGLNNGADDIAKANMAHHGTKTSIPGYTWHHLEDGKTLILIPTDLHEAYRHTGGADLLREGLKEAM